MSNSDTQAPTPGQRIPTSPDFPINRENPRDAKITWMSSSCIQNACSATDFFRG